MFVFTQTHHFASAKHHQPCYIISPSAKHHSHHRWVISYHSIILNKKGSEVPSLATLRCRFYFLRYKLFYLFYVFLTCFVALFKSKIQLLKGILGHIAQIGSNKQVGVFFLGFGFGKVSVHNINGT